MFAYILRRLFLLPLTLLCIVLVNFVIINLAPGDPVTVTEISVQGDASRKEGESFAFGTDERYLQFREHFGLTLPVLFNGWIRIKEEAVRLSLWQLIHRRKSVGGEEISVKDYDAYRTKFGDQARFVMHHLLAVLNDAETSAEEKLMATRFFMRGGTKQAILGGGLSKKDKRWNRLVAKNNAALRALRINSQDTEEERQKKISLMNVWYEKNRLRYNYSLNTRQKLVSFFFETRFFRYLSRVVTMDFGSLRNDSSRKVINEVFKRLKYSLILAALPLGITFILCQVFGFLMAYRQNGWQDISLNVLFLILFAVPVFVVAPFLIEKVALNGFFPFTDIAIPISGFTSEEAIYSTMTSKRRLFDTIQHIALPLVAIMYGGLAAQSRLSRTAVLEVMRHDYIRTARAKGVHPFSILVKHVGRNAAITIVTAIAGSLGIVLGGSLIVETLFEINGFGKFFYDAVINRDYNVIMFSALMGSFLTLMGYLVADITYTLLDPRVTLD